MKKITLILVALLVLTACSSNRMDDEMAFAGLDSAVDSPKVPGSKPKLPASAQLQANAMAAIDQDENNSGSEIEPEQPEDEVLSIAKDVDEGLDMEALFAKLEKEIPQQRITNADIERGFYYAGKLEKRLGTPDAWIWIEDGLDSRWSSSTAIETATDVEVEEMCRKTSGRYAVSCIEREVPHCEYIPKSECRCLESSVWVDDQGCILSDEGGNPIHIDQEELLRGWYLGLPNEKKLNTPKSWIWIEDGVHSHWQNPIAE